METNSFLGTEKLTHLMRKYSLPCILSLLVAALYNIVDQIFIANASYLGSHGNAANTVVYPLTVIALAIAVMIGDGACSFISIALGEGKGDESSHAAGNAIVLSLISSVLVMAIYLVFSDAIITAFGGAINEQTFTLAKEYFLYITIGIPFYMFGQAMNPIIRADGSPRFAMVFTVGGAVINIILDPVFIFVFKWGMMGAAVATVLGQVFTAAMSAWYLTKTKCLKITAKDFRLVGRISSRILVLGITSFLAQFSIVVVMVTVNNVILVYSAKDPVFCQESLSHIPMAVVGIVMKFFQIVISISVGAAAGCIPVAGYQIGARLNDRAKKLFTLLLSFEALVGLIALIIAEFLPHILIDIFGAAGESEYYTQFAIKAFRIYFCMAVLALVNKGATIYLQAMGKAFLSTMLSLFREIVFGVAFSLILPIFLGLDGVLWQMPCSDLLTFIMTVFVIRRTYRELGK